MRHWREHGAQGARNAIGHRVLEMQWGTGCWECNEAQGGGAGTRASRGNEPWKSGLSPRAYHDTAFLGCSPLALTCFTQVTLRTALFCNKWLQGSMPSSASLSHPEKSFYSHAFQSFCPIPVSLSMEFRN